MADLKISELPAATTPLAGTEVVPIVQSGTTKKVAVSEIGGGGWTTVFKTADEVRSSNTTETADNTLTLALAASSLYFVKFRAFISIANATMDFKFSVAYSGTTSSVIARRNYRIAGAPDSGSTTFDVVLTTLGGGGGVVGATAGVGIVDYDIIINTTNAGTLSFLWAQNTSDAGEIRCKAGSYMEWAKIA